MSEYDPGKQLGTENVRDDDDDIGSRLAKFRERVRILREVESKRAAAESADEKSEEKAVQEDAVPEITIDSEIETAVSEEPVRDYRSEIEALVERIRIADADLDPEDERMESEPDRVMETEDSELDLEDMESDFEEVESDFEEVESDIDDLEDMELDLEDLESEDEDEESEVDDIQPEIFRDSQSAVSRPKETEWPADRSHTASASVEGLRESLQALDLQMKKMQDAQDNTNSELSEKLHKESVKSYRNLQSLLKQSDEEREKLKKRVAGLETMVTVSMTFAAAAIGGIIFLVIKVLF